ncbi:transforming growth factor-beta receptor-associated protein 1 isoform X2 [Cololabis saira]|uniref:transforming growth factor-beta receptor-associated protein 1 isoform X2 n=1 Tax=Cololabis saira TaxID=129043 RepID=UPI002AD5A548|nr:transforming growth factor-beta receptor-associated protein 1 isoform X2 [Cololabis saira]
MDLVSSAFAGDLTLQLDFSFVPLQSQHPALAMAFRAFTQVHVYEKQGVSKEKDKTSIQCLECYDRNVYMGTKDATVQHLILSRSTNGVLNSGQTNTREGRARKLGSSGSVVKLRAVPLLNHLLVLWDRSVTALNMFSLEPVPTLKKIQHVSLFELCDSSLETERACVQIVTSSSRRKVIQIHVVGVSRWEVVKEVSLLQEPVALALDGTSLCVATAHRYVLCNIHTGSTEELFSHNHRRQQAFVASVGRGEFLLNGPECLGVFVMKTGTCQRPPLQWPREVLAVGVYFPYILALEPHVLSVYSMLDQLCKQTLNLSGGQGLLSTSDGVLAFTERDVFSLKLVPFEEQIRELLGHDRVEEALVLLDGVQSYYPLDTYEELQKATTRLAGFVHFYQEDFAVARDLFIKGELDPREIIHTYPHMGLSEGFQSQFDQVNHRRDLKVIWEGDRNTFHRYLAFLGDYLRAVRATEQGLACVKQVDGALLWLYVQLQDHESLQQLVDFPNECSLDHCVSVLDQHNRFFALGSLYKSHGIHTDAIETWMKIVDGIYKDPTCSDVYGHIVKTLTQLKDRETVWAFADWTLQRNQKVGVQIFTKRPPDDQFENCDVLALLEKYPRALLLYLEFLTCDLNSKEERYHSRLILAYVAETLQEQLETELDVTRAKLQQLLWESKCYDVSAVYDRMKSTSLHLEKAILLGRTGDHPQALQLLVHQERDLQAAEAYCCRAARDQDSHLLFTLLQIYLSSPDLTGAALDLLKNHPQAFAAEKVIQLLPDSWSVQLASHSLIGSLRTTFHQRQMLRVQKGLAQAELLRHQVIWMQASKTKFRVNREQRCSVCQDNLTEPQFSRDPRGELMHTSCARSTLQGQ